MGKKCFSFEKTLVSFYEKKYGRSGAQDILRQLYKTATVRLNEGNLDIYCTVFISSALKARLSILFQISAKITFVIQILTIIKICQRIPRVL